MFPHTQFAGNEEITFEKESDYLEFLKVDLGGCGWIMEIYKLYQIAIISIHILTTNVDGMPEPKARWTHLSPDGRLRSFSTVPEGLHLGLP